jgi:urate oxidase
VSRIAASSHGEARIRMLRTVARGDRHDPRDLAVSVRFEGQFESAFLEGRSDALLPGEAVKNLVHLGVRQHGAGEIETLGLSLCTEILARQPLITRARVEIAEQRWQRLEAGGRTQPQVFVGGSPERRTVVVTSNGPQVSVVSGIEHLPLLRSAGFKPLRAPDDDAVVDRLPRLLVGELSARWTYTSGDVTFGPYRQGVRAAILDTAAWHASQSVQHALYATADVILSTYEEIADVTLAFHERPYRPADPFAAEDASAASPDDLFVAIDEPVGIVEVTVERS